MAGEVENKELKENKGKKSKKALIVVIILAVLALIGGLVAFLLNNQKMRAVVIRLILREGTVTMEDAGGKESTLVDNMRLKSGSRLVTGADGMLKLDMDNSKIVTILENSRLAIEKSGKALALDLEDGQMFMNLPTALNEDETFDIRTSTMVVGIRGTAVYLDENEGELYLLHGRVHVIGHNPTTGGENEIDMEAGMKIRIYLFNDKEGEESVQFFLEPIGPYDLPAELRRIMRGDQELIDSILQATKWSEEEFYDWLDGTDEPDPEPEPEPGPEAEPGVVSVTYVIGNVKFDAGEMYESFIAGEGLASLPVPKQEGYTFDGWYLDSGYSISVASLDKTFLENVTLYGRWIKDSEEIGETYSIGYTVKGLTSFNAGSFELPRTYVSGSEDEIQIGTPNLRGYTFDGWYTDEAMTHKFSGIISKEDVGNLTLYGEAIPMKYNISYKVDGYNYDPKQFGVPETYTYNVETVIGPTGIDGYYFYGWHCDQLGSDITITIPAGTMGDIELYAEVKPKPDENPDENPETYNITYSVEGLSGFNAENYGLPTSYTAGTIRALSAPEITGYTFDGWYSDSARTTRIDSISADTTGDVTVYGIATAASYTISYQVDGLDSFSAADYDLPTTYTYGAETALGTPTITGYTFAGWYSDANHTTGITAISATTTGDVTVYGTATANTYNITYAVTRSDTGAAIDVSALDLPATYTYGAAADLTQIADEDITGFGTFSGWKLGGTTVTAIPADRTGDVALTGTLTALTYDITFTVYRETEPDGVQTIDTGTTLATWTSTYTYGNAPELADALPAGTDTTGFGAFEAGWFTNTGCTTAAAPAATDSGDKTYYSFLKADRYTITYYTGADGMEATPEELAANYGYADAISEYFYDPNRDLELTPLDVFELDPGNGRGDNNGSYSYGWYRDFAHREEITTIPAGYAQDVELYAAYEYISTNSCYANGIIMNGNTNEFYYSYGDVDYYLDTVLLDEYTEGQGTYRYYGVAGSDVRQIAGNIGLQTLIKNGTPVGTVGYDGTVHRDSLLVSPSGKYYLKFTPTRAESAAGGEQPIVPVYLVYNGSGSYGGFDGGWTLTEPQ